MVQAMFFRRLRLECTHNSERNEENHSRLTLLCYGGDDDDDVVTELHL